MRNNETIPYGADDPQPDDETPIGERPTLRWIRITHKERAPVTQRFGSNMPLTPKPEERALPRR
jgi:hypothetical protein